MPDTVHTETLSTILWDELFGTGRCLPAIARSRRFRLDAECGRRILTIGLMRKMRETVASHGVPPPGLHVLIGPEAPQRLGNMTRALENGTIAPVEFIARAV